MNWRMSEEEWERMEERMKGVDDIKLEDESECWISLDNLRWSMKFCDIVISFKNRYLNLKYYVGTYLSISAEIIRGC